MTQPQQTGKQKVVDKLSGFLTEYGHHCHTRERMLRELKSLELVIETMHGKIAGLKEGLPLLADREESAPKQSYPIKMPEQPEPEVKRDAPPAAVKAPEPPKAVAKPVAVEPKRGRGRPAKKQSVTKVLEDLGEASAQVGEIRARAS